MKIALIIKCDGRAYNIDVDDSNGKLDKIFNIIEPLLLFGDNFENQYKMFFFL